MCAVYQTSSKNACKLSLRSTEQDRIIIKVRAQMDEAAFAAAWAAGRAMTLEQAIAEAIELGDVG